MSDVAKKPTREQRLYDALKRISAYQSPDRLRQTHWRQWGLDDPAEAIGVHDQPKVLHIPYSTDWSRGGPLIERFGVSLSPPTGRVHRNGGPNAGWGELGVWMATTWRPRKGDGHRPIGSGDTPLQAVARCIVDLHSAGAPK